MPGVQTCRFSLSKPDQGALRSIPVHGVPLQFEVFFCFSGHLIIQPLTGGPSVVEDQEILLLSDSSELHSCQYGGDLCGLLVAVDASAAKESLMTICSILGMDFDTKIVKQKMAANSGCIALHYTPWTQAFFETMQHLSAEVQARYCVFKSVELLYLLCTEAAGSDSSPSGAGCPISQILLEVKTYIHTRLSEKLTIDLLCKQFSLPHPLKGRLSPHLWDPDPHLFDPAASPAGAGADLHHADAHPADRPVCWV